MMLGFIISAEFQYNCECSDSHDVVDSHDVDDSHDAASHAVLLLGWGGCGGCGGCC